MYTGSNIPDVVQNEGGGIWALTVYTFGWLKQGVYNVISTKQCGTICTYHILYVLQKHLTFVLLSSLVLRNNPQFCAKQGTGWSSMDRDEPSPWAKDQSTHMH